MLNIVFAEGDRAIATGLVEVPSQHAPGSGAIVGYESLLDLPGIADIERSFAVLVAGGRS